MDWNNNDADINVAWSDESPKMTIECDFERIHLVAGAFLKKIKEGEPQSYRLEMKRMKTTEILPCFSVSMILDPVFWFNTHMADNPNRLEKARAWVNSVRASMTRTGLRYTYMLDENVQHVVRWADQYCDYAVGCSYAKDRNQGCHRKHSPISCASSIYKANKKQEPCGWYCCENLILPFFEDEDCWITCARSGPEMSRDTLLFPRPLNWKLRNDGAIAFLQLAKGASSWKGHYNNAELATMPDFWKAVIEVENQLKKITREEFPLESVALNFGKWEKRQAQDDFSLECHGHAHLVLSREAQRKLAAIRGFEAIRGRYNDPSPYSLKDVEALEGNLTSLEVSSLNSKMGTLNSRMDTLETTLNSRMNTLETTLNSRMNTLETTLNSRMDTLEASVKSLHGALAHLEKSIIAAVTGKSN